MKLLVIGYVWPEPTSSAAGSRMMQLLDFFLKENYHITFATAARDSEHKADLNSLGIQTERIKLNHPDFDILLEDLNPNIVLFDRFMMEEQYGWRVDKILPDAVKILDTEDLHFLRNARQLAFKENKNVANIYIDSDLAKREIAAIYRCDLSLIISEKEVDLLVSEFQLPEKILYYLPFLLNEISEETKNALPGFEKRKDFISIGNFLHEPNWKATLYLKEQLWPEIRKKLPEAKMQIYGAYPSQKVLNLHNEKENFIVNGWAENSGEVMKNSKVCLAPILFGAGLKGKLAEAMQNGTTSVTTPIGAEGINGNLEWNGFITENDEEFIKKSISLYTNRKLWQEKQDFGFQIIKERFDQQQHIIDFKHCLEQVVDNLKKHRKFNFTGEMLKHHLHKSTYFMSRFIEEKNKNKN